VLSTFFGKWNIAQFIKDNQFILGQLFLELGHSKSAIGLDELIHQAGRNYKHGFSWQITGAKNQEEESPEKNIFRLPKE
jgi:hypothetical protein